MTHSRAGHAAVALMLVAVMGAYRSPAPQQAQRRALPGDLTKAIDQYSGDEFFALVNGLNYTGGQQRARRCRGNNNCAAGNTRTNVRVDAVTGEDSLSPGNLPQFGVVALKAVVRGNDTEAMYGMQSAGPNGRFSYYLIVSPGAAAGAATWRLEELNIQGNTRTHRTLAQGRFTPCDHAYVPGARADFKTCAEAAASAAGPTRFLNVSFGSRQASDPPMWIGCAAGCCIMDSGAGT